MRIGIIGTGNIGGTLARKLSAAGHDVRVANSRGPEGVGAFANKIGAIAVDTRGAVKSVDLIVISVPFPAVAELPKDLFDTVPQDVPVIDTCLEPIGRGDYRGQVKGTPNRVNAHRRDWLDCRPD